jgi:hypothetical protein
MSLEMAHKVILPPKKNYIPQFLKQRDINSYSTNNRFGNDLKNRHRSLRKFYLMTSPHRTHPRSTPSSDE